MNANATMRLNHFCITDIFPKNELIDFTLKARSQATIKTGSAVATAYITGNRYPPLAVADMGINMPK